MKKNKRSFALFVALLLTTALALSACTDRSQNDDNNAVVLDEVFVQEFNPNVKTMHTLQSSAQDVDLQSSLNDVTVHVRQTLGDAKTMYIALKVTIPEELDASIESVSPQICEFVSGTVDEKDLSDLSSADLLSTYIRNGAMAGGGSMHISAVSESMQDNSLLYLLVLNSDEPFHFEEDTATLLIGDFTVVRGDGTGKTYPGVHAISWQPAQTELSDFYRSLRFIQSGTV